MDQTYMKEKPILPLLLSMALPMVISMFVNSLYNIIDSIFVAKISEDAMTALSLVYPVQNLINSIAVGNMVITMIALMTGCIVNIVLDPLLIFGIGFFPKLGIQGAALATGIGQSSTLILYLIVYVLRPIHVKIRKDYLKLEAVCVKRLYAIGIPATLNMALPSFRL